MVGEHANVASLKLVHWHSTFNSFSVLKLTFKSIIYSLLSVGSSSNAGLEFQCLRYMMVCACGYWSYCQPRWKEYSRAHVNNCENLCFYCGLNGGKDPPWIANCFRWYTTTQRVYASVTIEAPECVCQDLAGNLICSISIRVPMSLHKLKSALNNQFGWINDLEQYGTVLPCNDQTTILGTPVPEFILPTEITQGTMLGCWYYDVVRRNVSTFGNDVASKLNEDDSIWIGFCDDEDGCEVCKKIERQLDALQCPRECGSEWSRRRKDAKGRCRSCGGLVRPVACSPFSGLGRRCDCPYPLGPDWKEFIDW